MTHDLSAALARVPSPVERFALTDGRTMFACDCGTDWCPDGWPGEPQGDRAEHHRPDCWWPPFVATREALAAPTKPSEPEQPIAGLPSDQVTVTHDWMEQAKKAMADLAAVVTVEGVVDAGERWDDVVQMIKGGGKYVVASLRHTAFGHKGGQRVTVTVRPADKETHDA